MHRLFAPVEGMVSLLEKHGATCFLVGGAVRDFLLGVPSKDLDIEVHGMEPDSVALLLKSFSRDVKIDEVGKAFGVLKATFQGLTFDFSFPRTERKTTGGHTGFDVTVDPFLGIEKALARRDFTMNAIAMRTDGALIDPFEGIQDIIAGKIRHVGPAFSEDPLRILRAVQFAGRFSMTLAPETAKLCAELAPELESISIERVWGEFEKIGLKGKSLAHVVEAVLDCRLGARFGPISWEFGQEPDLRGLEGDRRVAVALKSIMVDPVKIGAPKSVTRMMTELGTGIAAFKAPQGAFQVRSLARTLKTVTIRDVFRIIGHRPMPDPRVIDGPLPVFVNGFDVLELGVKGQTVGALLKDATELQDRGVFSDRPDALDWLQKQVRRLG